MLDTTTKKLCALLVVMSCMVVISEACCKRHPPKRDTCPPSMVTFADEKQTKKRIYWKDPVFKNKRRCNPVTYEWRTNGRGKKLDEFECDGEKNKVVITAKNNEGTEGDKKCYVSITCKTTKCEPIKDGGNRTVHCSYQNKFGSECEFQCSEGFDLHGQSKSTCKRNKVNKNQGIWTPDLPKCKAITCDPLGSLDHGTIECTDENYYKSSCSFECDGGFKLTEDRDAKCMGHDGWSRQKPKCVDAIPPVMTCPQVTVIADGDGLARNVTWDDVVAVDNIEGNVAVKHLGGPPPGSDLPVDFYTITYEAIDSLNNQATCSFLLIVKRVFCSPLYGSYREIFCTNGFNLDSVCTFQCSTGYVLEGFTSLTCQRNGSSGNWNGEKPICKEVTCPALSAPENGGFRNGMASCPVTYGSWCEFECNEGYSIVGSRSRRCNAQRGDVVGTWQGEEPQCRAITCLMPYVANGAFITNTDECHVHTSNPAGTICRYDCQEGHLLVGSPVIHCDIDGLWNTSAPRCDILRCKSADLPEPENGFKRGCPYSEEHYGTVCELGCNLGYEPAEVTPATCRSHSNGTSYWSDTVPVCEATTCQPIKSPRNGNSTTCTFLGQPLNDTNQPHHYRTICTTTCNAGFTASGSHSRICQINGNWDGVPLDCADKDPPILVVPTIPVKYADPLQEHVVVDYNEWESKIMQSVIDVSSPVLLELTKMNGARVEGPQTTIFREGIHLLEYTCTDQVGNKKTFSLQLIVQVKRCRPLSLHEDSIADSLIGSADCNREVLLGTICSISCDDGFHTSAGAESVNVTCVNSTSTGNWSGENSLPQCMRNQCNLTELDNGYISGCYGQSVDFDTTCHFRCFEGYTDKDDRRQETRRCLQDGTWTGKDLLCEAVQCTGPLSLTHGVVVPPEDCETALHIPYGTKCIYQCDSGFSLAGPSTSVCQEDGRFSFGNFICEDNQAPQFTSSCPHYIEEIAEMGQRSKVIHFSTPSAEDNSGAVTVTRFRGLAPGSEFSEGYHVTTYRAEDQSGNSAHCDVIVGVTVKRCNIPQAPIGGSLVNCGWINGATCEYRCNDGYELVGVSQRRCQLNDSLPLWDSPSPTCQAIVCPALNVSANVVKSGCNNNEEFFGTVCSLYCPYGFSSSGSSVSRCQADGNWDVNDFICQESRCPPLDVPDDATVTPSSCKDNPSYGDSCVLSCRPGFQVIPPNHASVYCKADGSWSSDISGASCKDYQPPHFTNCPMDHTIYLEPGFSNVYVNWNLNVTDNSGLVISPVTCNFDRQRLPIGFYLVTCSASDAESNYAYCSFAVTVRAHRCPVLHPPPMGRISGPCVNFYGTTCKIECLSGFSLHGSKSATCQRDELTGEMFWEYEDDVASCKILTCPPITDAHLGSEFAAVYPSVCQYPDELLPGSTCILYCTHHLTLQTVNTELTCLPNATWDYDLNNLNVQCIDEVSPVVVFCPSDIHVVLTPDSPVAIINFVEPTATDNSNQPLRIERSPENVTSPHICSGDEVVSFKFFDGGNNFADCTFRIIVEDNLYPVLEDRSCPGDINITSPSTKTAVEWTPPVFYELTNDELEITCNYHPGHMFPYGTYHVQYIATNPTNSKSTICNFVVSVNAPQCLELRAPDNGALACFQRHLGALCFQSCQTGWLIPTIDGYPFYGRFSCYAGQWVPSEVYDCSVAQLPGRIQLPNELQYFSGDCESSAAQENIRTTFIDLITMDVNLFAEYCQDDQNCTLANVHVTCGDVTAEGRRKRRSISALLENQSLIRDSNAYKQRRQKVISFRESKTSPFHSRHRRNTLGQYEINIYFDLLVDLPEGSEEDFEKEVQATEASLYGLSDEIARRVENGELVPQVEGLNMTVHDEPVVYYYINAVCETGFISDPQTLSCGACPSGTFYNEDEDTCDPCPIGFYQNDTAQLSCNSCPVGMSTLHRGSINITECIPFCEPGTSSPTGLFPCFECDIGSYQPEMGALQCIACPEGTLCLSDGSTSVEQCIEQCPPGTVSPTGLIPCSPCSIHSYQPVRGETFCHPCPDDYITSEEGSAYRHNCSILTGQALCDMGQCLNGGTCMPGLDNFNCTCPLGYFGRFCDVFIDICDLNDCYNNGTCVDSPQGFTCFCSEDFTGTDCSIPVDSCFSDPCENNGTCLREGSGYVCYCPQLYWGDHCENKIQYCDSNPCNHGRCVNNIEDPCDCYPGYTGKFCEEEVNECSSDPCFNEGLCTDLINGFTCSCLDGFTGVLCEVDVDLCQGQPCPEYSSCVDLDTRYLCVCPAGKNGSHCENDILPCQSYPCQNGATCLNNGSNVIGLVDIGYSCKCVPGFSGVNCEVEVNECESQPCSNGGTCQDLHNNFICQCSPGFTGPRCEFLEDPCSSSPCLNDGTCIETNEIGAFRCQCTSNYGGDRCQDLIRWCINSTCMNGGRCSDDQVIRTCDCTSGYRGTYCEIQIEPCNPNPCLNDGECIDSGTGDFTCRCASGFTGSHCEERLPFCESSPCQNNGTCVKNESDSYCNCGDGYEGRFCENIKDVCMRNKCVHGHCVQRDVKHYDCNCKDGYTGRYCAREIDECTPNPCAHSTACHDLVAGFSCTCEDGWEGEFCDMKIDDCIGHSCVNGATCVDEFQTYRCICPKGFTGLHCEENINDCGSDPCPSGASCIDGINEFTCQCPSGYTGDECNTLQTSPCTPNPCMHGGLCGHVRGQAYFFCLCPKGTEGITCEININDCNDHHCQNDATCLDQIDSYSCVCPTGFNGTYCENALTPCIAEPCQNGGSCVEQNGSAICYCQDGYVGSRCEVNEDDCVPNPCNNDGTCIDGINQFTCICDSGFIGDTCQDNIDDCVDHACENGATCVDELEKYSCRCQRAYYGDYCQLQFEADFDFNMTGTHSEVIFKDSKPVSNLTISFWMSSTPSDDVCIMEYQPAMLPNGSSTEDRALSITVSSDHFIVNLLGVASHIEEIVSDERWHHIVLTWSFNFLNVFVDGRLATSHQLTDAVDEAYILAQHGTFCFGNCNSKGSDANLILSRVNIWQYVLDDSLIHEMATNCSLDVQGDILISQDLLDAIDSTVNIISPSQCDAFDDCASSPCSEEATCIDGYHGYTCVCPPYFTGTTCHNDIDDCLGNSCANGSTCVDGRGNFTCMCPEDTTGRYCELNMVHGRWGNWSLWTDCSQSCGGGNKSRVRVCSSPPPLNGGLPCQGESLEISECNTQDCPVCQQVPTVKNGYLTCNSSEDWVHFCIHHCDEGLVAGVPVLDSYHCGESTFYSWNVEDEDNPSLRVPSCVEPVTLSQVKVEYFSSYPDLSCTTENQHVVIEEITTATDLMLSRVCSSASECYLDGVTVQGCPGDDDFIAETNVTKVISFVIDYFPGLETLSVNESVVGPIIGQLIEDDVENGMISIDGQIYGVDITTISTEGTPLCPNGTYIDTEINVRCAPCESGSFWQNGLCFFCPAGSYQPDERETFCHPCPPGTSSNIGAVSIDECEITDDAL